MPNQRKYTLFALFTLCICVLAIYIHRHRQGQTGRIDNLLISSAGNVQRNLSYVGFGFRAIVDHYMLLVNTQKQNEDLEQEVLALKAQVTALQEIELENQRLRSGLVLRDATSQPMLAARVVAHDVSSDYHGIRIDRGTDHGVRVGMGVISSSGLVGRVLRASPTYSDVLTLLDPSSNIDVIIQRSRARGVLTGQAKALHCKLKYLDRLEDVAVNDTAVASGFNAIFPKGLLVGYVTSVSSSGSGILQTISVRSAVDIYRLEEVFVVFPPAQPEKTS